jgi:hypothetical protein
MALIKQIQIQIQNILFIRGTKFNFGTRAHDNTKFILYTFTICIHLQ